MPKTLYALQDLLNANIRQFENKLCFAEFLFVFGSREPKIASSCKNSIAQLQCRLTGIEVNLVQGVPKETVHLAISL